MQFYSSVAVIMQLYLLGLRSLVIRTNVIRTIIMMPTFNKLKNNVEFFSKKWPNNKFCYAP